MRPIPRGPTGVTRFRHAPWPARFLAIAGLAWLFVFNLRNVIERRGGPTWMLFIGLVCLFGAGIWWPDASAQRVADLEGRVEDLERRTLDTVSFPIPDGPS